MQQYKGFVAGLECLVEGFRKGGRGIGIGRVDVGQRGIEALMPESLPDKEGVGPLLDKQHSRRVFQNMGMLQGFTKASFPGDLAEQRRN